MKIDCYRFVFHPFDAKHSSVTKVVSVVTNIALSILTGGLYLAAFGLVHLQEKLSQPAPSKQMTAQIRQGFAGIHALKQKQSESLQKLQAFAKKGEWQHLQTHTTHPDSGFDWWMFPIDRPSSGYGEQYQVSRQDVEMLKRDAEFMKNYRTGVILVAKSWGWDVQTGQLQPGHGCRWIDYQVRLGKMLDSLKLFGQYELHRNLVRCIDAQGIRSSLKAWIQKLL